MPGIKNKPQTMRTLITASVLVAGAICGGVIGYLDDVSDAGAVVAAKPSMMLALMVALAVGFGVLCVVGGRYWMATLDEAAQEAHKWAWYWGGSIGMAVGLAGMLVLMLPSSRTLAIPSVLDGRTDPAAYLFTGALALLAPMMVGYLLSWAVWWWQRR